MSHIVILGGGFGGVSVATRLRSQLDDVHQVTLVDRKAAFMMGLRKPWLLVGHGTKEAGTRPLAALEARGITVLRAEVTDIDPAERRVETSAGPLQPDYLVVALGAEPAPEQVPGFQDYNIWNQYDVNRAAKRLAGLQSGRVVVGILGLPYKCPPAPYECTFLVDEMLRTSGRRDAVSLEIFSPQPTALPIAGPDASSFVEATLAERDIGFHAGAVVERVEASQVVMEDGRTLAYDVLLGVPPHRCPEVVVESGLTAGGPWVKPDPHTFRTDFPNVFAIGDVTMIPLGEGRALPKAGVFAEAEGLVVADEILSEIRGGAAPPYDGHGYCYLELGVDLAASMRGDFYNEAGPAVNMVPPSAANAAEKRAFEAERLRAWFGG